MKATIKDPLQKSLFHGFRPFINDSGEFSGSSGGEIKIRNKDFILTFMHKEQHDNH